MVYGVTVTEIVMVIVPGAPGVVGVIVAVFEKAESPQELKAQTRYETIAPIVKGPGSSRVVTLEPTVDRITQVLVPIFFSTRKPVSLSELSIQESVALGVARVTTGRSKTKRTCNR
jgi:hypothetical protein